MSQTPATLVQPATTHADQTHFGYPSRNARFMLPVDRVLAKRGLRRALSLRQRIKLALEHLSARRAAPYAETALMAQVRMLANQPEAPSMISLGTPGPYNKQTILFLDAEGQPVSVAKISATQAAGVLVAREAEWLRWLQGVQALSGTVPRLLAESSLGEVHVLVQSSFCGEAVSSDLRPAQLRFLARLHQASRQKATYSESPMRDAMQRRLEALSSTLSPAWLQRSERILAHLDARFATVTLPLVLAHRDFSAWNMRRHQEEVFVFDWEYASLGYIPMYDLFHYLLMPIAQRRAVSSAQARQLVAEAERRYRAGIAPDSFAPDVQFLAYLLDLCLFYLESNGGRDEGDRIVARYGSLIDRYDHWRIS